MKQYSKKLFSLVVLCSTATVMLQTNCDDDNGNRVVPFLQWRSQGRDTARKLYGTTSYAVYQDDMDSVYGTFNATLQYDQTFRGNRLLCALFGASLVSNPSGITTTTTSSCNSDCDNSCDDFIVISGLETSTGTPNTTRAKTDWMAENFLLPRDFKSAISFSPKVRDVLLDLNLYVGLDRWVKGLYFRLYGPITWNKASLDANETIITKGTRGYEAGYFDELDVPASSLFTSALNFFGGCQLPAYDGQEVTIQPLKFAKFSNCNLPSTSTNNCNNDCDDSCGFSHHKTGFAELRGEFGWNYIQEKYRLMINIQAAAPTGTRPNAEFLFPAQIGNGKHWELGVGVGGSWKMWESVDAEKSFNFIVEADVTHLFNAKQTRTFDLKGKPNSRYMLAEQMVATSSLPADQQIVGGTFQFAETYAPVANLSTQNVKVSIGAQGDVVAMFNFTCRGFSWDLGYNFWGMSKSKIHCTDDCSNDSCNNLLTPFPANTWALKGDASTFGYFPVDTTDNVIALGATESAATIFTGTNVSLALPLSNPGIDPVVTPAAAVDGGALFVADTTTPINTSVPPVFIAATDFDFDGASQRGISNKVFTHFSYTWTNREKYIPYVGAGFSAEFGSTSCGDDCPTTTTTTTNNCSSSVSCALSKWAVEIKGGVSFH
ncbi:MAG TPA: hypothetical protein VKR54_03370 [Candidatus Babeliales bacterium]|jgi:hypothetical protein|nr:hypothetical protein [Candidatus Babeliales bacterium]